MLISNTTKTFTPHAIRKMVEFCCRTIGCNLKIIKWAKFTTRKHGGPANGHADLEYGKILVRVNETNYRYPTVAGRRWPACADIWDAAVYVTGHEIQHIVEWVNGTHYAQVKARDLEPHCDRIGIKCLEAFRARRAELMAAWNPAPVAAVVKPAPAPAPEPEPAPPAVAALSPLISARAAKAMADLARWERRLKMAKTKVAKYRARVRYYDRKAGAR